MADNSISSSPTSDRLLEVATRTLRHEVGDLLQTIYSTVAILQERLPTESRLERRFLSDLRGRAEICKHELDAVHDLVLPVELRLGAVDLTELAGNMVTAVAARHPALNVRFESSGPLPIEADAARLDQVGRLLLAGACQSAQREIVVRARASAPNGEIEWSIADDGYGATPEQLQWLATPFATTQQALCGLGLALARRIVELHGGRISAVTPPEGGLRVELRLPRRIAAGEP